MLIHASCIHVQISNIWGLVFLASTPAYWGSVGRCAVFLSIIFPFDMPFDFIIAYFQVILALLHQGNLMLTLLTGRYGSSVVLVTLKHICLLITVILALLYFTCCWTWNVLPCMPFIISLFFFGKICLQKDISSCKDRQLNIQTTIYWTGQQRICMSFQRMLV